MESDSASEDTNNDNDDSDEINDICKTQSSAVQVRMVVFVATLLAAVGVSLRFGFALYMEMMRTASIVL
jgi:hypothetical protein